METTENSYKDAVFSVTLLDGDKQRGHGTGFLVSPDLVLTARHVVARDSPSLQQGDHGIMVSLPGGNRVNATVACDDVETDWALLRLESSVQGVEPIPLRNSETIQPDEGDWESWGYPTAFAEGVKIDGTVEDWSGPEAASWRVQLRYNQKTLPPKGCSGAPLMMKGCAVGLLQSKAPHPIKGMLFATPSAAVLSHEKLPRLPLRLTRFASPGATPAERRNLKLLDHLREYDPATSEEGRIPFHIQGAFAETFDDLLARSYSEPLSADEILDRSQWQRILIHAHGGAGKTRLMCELARAAVSRSIHTFYLVATRMKEAKHEEEFFSQCSENAAYDDFARLKDDSSKVLLLVDGLNELEQASSRTILRYCRKLSESDLVRLVVTDRMNERDQADAVNFERVAIVPLSHNHIGECLSGKEAMPEDEKSLDLLSTPFFLQLYLELLEEQPRAERPGKIRRRRMFEDYYRDIVKIQDEAQLLALAKAAFDAIQSAGGLEFDNDWVADADRLHDAGLTVSRGEGRRAFRHQLLQDYLIGVHIAGRGPTGWDGSSFDQATLSANSPEPIVLAAEHLAHVQPGQTDGFVEQVYDWSVDIAFNCLADLSEAADEHPISGDLAKAVTALYAERCHERIVRTVERTREHLRRIVLPGTGTLARAADRSELESVVRGWEFKEPRYKQWQELFLMQPEEEIGRHHVALLARSPVIGWTAANVLRRMPLSDLRLAQIRIIYDVVNDRSVRWRVVHALGTHPTPDNVLFLEGAASDETYPWVTYGAVRSLMEIASLPGSRHRQAILGWIERNLEAAPPRRFLRAFLWSTVVRDGDSDWYDSVCRLLQKGVLVFGDDDPDWKATLATVERHAETAGQTDRDAARPVPTEADGRRL